MEEMTLIRRRLPLLVAVPLIVAGALGLALALDRAAAPATAQSGFQVTPAQLKINQRISQAAVRRSNRANDRLDKLEAAGGGAGAAAGPAGPPGPAGPQGAPGTALAYATITSAGNVVAAQSEGVTDDMVDRDATGTYCFSSLPPGTRNVVVTADSTGLLNTSADRIAMVGFATAGTPNWSGCSDGTDLIRVTMSDVSAAALADTRFQIWFEG